MTVQISKRRRINYRGKKQRPFPILMAVFLDLCRTGLAWGLIRLGCFARLLYMRAG